MQTNTWQAIAATPWWMYVLFAYLMLLSHRAAKPHDIYIKQLTIATLLFIAMAVFGMIFFVTITTHTLTLLTVTFMLGFGTGWLWYNWSRLEVAHNGAAVKSSGSYLLMIILPFILIARYYYSSSMAIDPLAFRLSNYSSHLMTLYGLAGGLMIGKLAYARYLVSSVER